MVGCTHRRAGDHGSKHVGEPASCAAQRTANAYLQNLVKFGAQLRLVIYPIARIAPNPPQGSVSCCPEAFFMV